MFTGIIETVGRVSALEPTAAGFRIRIVSDLGAEVRAGDSIAVNGVCLTATAAGTAEISAEIGPETARVTTMSCLKAGAAVNLERAMRADGRFGGHLVLGHVDAMGAIESLRQEAEFWWVTVSYPSVLDAYLIHRGSIAVDGISLTVAARPGVFVCRSYTPGTIRTSKGGAGGSRQSGCDVVKYVVRAAEVMGSEPASRGETARR